MPNAPPRTTRPRLQVERLEDRTTPSTAQYVAGLYTTVLHRAPAPADVQTWVAVIDNGVPVAQTALALTTSPEVREQAVIGDYQGLLGRLPSPAEAAAWLPAFQAGLTEPQVSALFMASDEYFQRNGGTAQSWLTGVYRDSLGRAPDAGGLQSWEQVLQRATRDAVTLAIVNSQESLGRVVSLAYMQVLGRAPDATGAAFWTAALGQGLAPANLLAVLASSNEFITRVAGNLDPITPVFIPAQPVFVGDPFFDPSAFSPGVDFSFGFDPFGFSSDPGFSDCGCGGFDSGFGGGFDGGSDGGF
jgi:hypothetical protein